MVSPTWQLARSSNIICHSSPDILQIDWITACYATHRLSGIVSPANAAHSTAELEHQLRSSGAKALITCVPLLEVALQAAKTAGIPDKNVFIFSLPRVDDSPRFTTIETLIREGAKLPALEALHWNRGQGARQPAFLCYSSGTSGLPVSQSAQALPMIT